MSKLGGQKVRSGFSAERIRTETWQTLFDYSSSESIAGLGGAGANIDRGTDETGRARAGAAGSVRFAPPRERGTGPSHRQRVFAALGAGALALVLSAFCDQAYGAQGDCCQPLSNGASPVATDCLFILQVAVGLAACVPECICAPRGILPTVTTDALECLRVAVGSSNDLNCNCATTTTTTLDLPLPADWEEAFDATEIGWMMSGWGPGDGSLWAVGGASDEGRILRQGSTGWVEIDPGVEVPLLNWVHGSSRKDVFVGGNGGTILHYDGDAWSQHATPITTPVWGLWANAPDDVWAVGGDSTSDGDPFIMHYDGSTWSLVTLPVLVRPGVHAFFKIWASGPDDAYAVGQNGAVLHYDGATFTELFLGVSADMIGIWGTAPNDVMIVGGRGTGEIVHYDGVAWSRAAPSSLPGLNGVWMRRPEVAHAVGVNGTLIKIDPSTLAVTPDPGPTLLHLHAIFGDEQGQLIALGANFWIPEHGVALIRELSDDD